MNNVVPFKPKRKPKAKPRSRVWDGSISIVPDYAGGVYVSQATGRRDKITGDPRFIVSHLPKESARIFLNAILAATNKCLPT